jgi:4-hydroxy-3-methylbut-2-en-1-yl diphosphate reductase
VIGEAPDQMILVETVEDVEKLQIPNTDKIAYLTQTTLSVDEANVIIAKLKERFPSCIGSPKEDICYATQNRQEALKSQLHLADAVVVVGSQNSSNTKRLAEIAVENNIPAYLIDAPEDIDLSWFKGDETVLLTAGASAPEDLVEGCIDFLRRAFGAEVEERVTREENVFFPLPIQLRTAGGSPLVDVSASALQPTV